MADVDPEEARGALEAADQARQEVKDEVGLPSQYWWGMAAGWLALGAIAQFCPWWLSVVAALIFGAGHAVIASQLLSGRRRTGGVQVSRTVAGMKNAVLVIGILVALVLLTIAFALILEAQDVAAPAWWSAVIVAVITAFGGPEILKSVRRWTRA